MQAATIETGNWWAMPRGGERTAWMRNYQQSLKVRHRTAIVEIVKKIGAETVLEVGCHCGPNLVRLCQANPAMRALGVDISTEAIEAGRAWMQQLRLADRIQLTAGRVPLVTAAVPSGSVDVVLSCYALAYIAPADLDAVLYDMGRIAAKAIILAEPQMEGNAAGTSTRSLAGYTEWVHNYQQAARWIGSWRGMRLGTVTIDPPVDDLRTILVAVRGE